jgi:hypothetical protein
MHPSLNHALLEWKSQSLYNQPEHFIVPSERLKGNKPLDLVSVLKKEEGPTCVPEDRDHRRGVAHFSTRLELCWRKWANISSRSATTGGIAAPCHEQVPAGGIEDQTLGTGQVGRRYFTDGYFAEDKPNSNSVSGVGERFRTGTFSFSAYRPLTSADLLHVRAASA